MASVSLGMKNGALSPMSLLDCFVSQHWFVFRVTAGHPSSGQHVLFGVLLSSASGYEHWAVLLCLWIYLALLKTNVVVLLELFVIMLLKFSWTSSNLHQ